VTSNDTRIRDRRDAKFPRKKWGEAVKRQADLVFEVLPTHDDTPSTLMHIDEIARRTGLNRPLVARAISYMRNEFGEGFIITVRARHNTGYALADGAQQADRYIDSRIKEEATRLRTVAQQMQTRIQVFGRNRQAREVQKYLDRVVTDLYDMTEDGAAV
jgi:hypothetical protein